MAPCARRQANETVFRLHPSRLARWPSRACHNSISNFLFHIARVVSTFVKEVFVFTPSAAFPTGGSVNIVVLRGLASLDGFVL